MAAKKPRGMTVRSLEATAGSEEVGLFVAEEAKFARGAVGAQTVGQVAAGSGAGGDGGCANGRVGATSTGGAETGGLIEAEAGAQLTRGGGADAATEAGRRSAGPLEC